MSKPSATEFDDLLTARESQYAGFSGQLAFRALPYLSQQRGDQLLQLFAQLGAPFNDAESIRFRAALESEIQRGFEEFGSAEVVVTYRQSQKGGLEYSLSLSEAKLAERFETWLPRGETLFGSHPDAMVLEVAASIGEHLNVLDLGAGNGRNTLALARLGHRVEAVEMTEGFALQIEKWARRLSLRVHVRIQDFLATTVDLPREHFDLIVLSQVTSHFGSSDDLERVLDWTSELLSRRGRIALTAFCADADYDPTPLARQVGVARWSTFYTEDELSISARKAGLKLTAEAEVVSFEREHLPASAWPPTSWFVDWAEGRNVFPVGRPPVRLKWRVYELV